MRTTYSPSLRANLTRDDQGRVRGVNHLDGPYWPDGRGARAGAIAYLRDMAETLKIPREQLRPLDHRVSYLDPRPLDVEYRLAEQKNLFNSATYAFHQTWLNVPVWAAGLTVTLEQAPRA